MARMSTKENKNIYQLTREELKLTRVTASELLEVIPPERIEKIENERSLPHLDEVLTMAEKYKRPDLCNYYCATSAPSDRNMCRRSRSRTCRRLHTAVASGSKCAANGSSAVSAATEIIS